MRSPRHRLLYRLQCHGLVRGHRRNRCRGKPLAPNHTRLTYNPILFANIKILTFIRAKNNFFQIITVEADSHMASVARDAFARYGYDRRIAILEGSSPDMQVLDPILCIRSFQLTHRSQAYIRWTANSTWSSLTWPSAPTCRQFRFSSSKIFSHQTESY